jgi:hypothetical protein
MDRKQLMEWFGYHPPSTPEVIAAHEAVRARIGSLTDWINDLLPDGREKSMALTDLDNAAMHANAAIARAQTVNPEVL